MVGLEHKLVGVDVGDIILITGMKGSAVGYVDHFNLVYVHLIQSSEYADGARYDTYEDIFPPSSMKYRLCEFESYEVLRKKNKERVISLSGDLSGDLNVR